MLTEEWRNNPVMKRRRFTQDFKRSVVSVPSNIAAGYPPDRLEGFSNKLKAILVFIKGESK
jgi:hypothetical protein